MTSERSTPVRTPATGTRFSYGWVIVAACTLMVAITYGLMFSYSVFFKPLADYFGWDRATVSLVYSASLVIRGAIAIGVGSLADRYGSVKVMVFCGFMVGLGLVLSSQVHTLWQFFLTYAVIEAIGLSGAFGIGTASVSRWFSKKPGLALGIVSTGAGLGILLIVPISERLVAAFSWFQAFIICGVVAGVVMIAAALLLRPPPRTALPADDRAASAKADNKIESQRTGATMRQAVGDSRMILFMVSLLFFFFGVQTVMVHLVNYATDIGITPLVAATLISIIGAVSIGGRLALGIGADRIGVQSTLVLTRLFLAISFICLIFAKSLWALYLFALIFGVPYGGEITQIPVFIRKYFGTKSMAGVVGLASFVTNIGGALGPWVAGKIFDNTRSYQLAFIAGALAAVVSLMLVLMLNRQGPPAKT